MHHEHCLTEPSPGNASRDALPCSVLYEQSVDNPSNDAFPDVVERVVMGIFLYLTPLTVVSIKAYCLSEGKGRGLSREGENGVSGNTMRG